MVKKYWWILAIAFMVFAKGYSNQFFIDKGYMQFDDTYEISYYEEFPEVYKSIAYESFPEVMEEVKIYYEYSDLKQENKIYYRQLGKINFDESLVSEKKKTSPLTVFRIIRLITIGVN